MPKYLITGVAGFIGSNIAHALIARGEEVRGIDDLSHGRRENIAGILNQFDFREADITDLPSIHSACEGVDYVLHQAALGSVPRSLDDPLASNHANVVGTLSVLQAARDMKVKRVIYASSSSAYGDTPVLPKREDMASSPSRLMPFRNMQASYMRRPFTRFLSLRRSASAISTCLARASIPRHNMPR